MFQDYSSSIKRASSNQDASVKAISLLLNGFPIKINDKELVLLDKIYERKVINGTPDAIESKITLSDLPYIIGTISNEEYNFITESYKFHVENKKHEVLVSTIVSSLKEDFSSLSGSDIVVSEYYDAYSLEKTTLKDSISIPVSSISRIRFSSNTLKMPGSRIDRIDGIWEFSIKGDNKKFIWGAGINLKKELVFPQCDILNNNEDEHFLSS